METRFQGMAVVLGRDGRDALRVRLSACLARLPSGETTRLLAFRACRRGSTAVEFAIIAPMLILTILFVMMVGVIFYYNQALDFATTKAARQIMIGAVQTNPSMNQTTFRTQVVCGYLPAVFNCNNVIVNVQTATEAAQPSGYYAFVTSNQSGLIIPTLSNSATSYSPGQQGSYEYIQVIYPLTFIPPAFASFIGQATYNGSAAYLAISTAAFRNEQY